jgi:hypothetical protein
MSMVKTQLRFPDFGAVDAVAAHETGAGCRFGAP